VLVGTDPCSCGSAGFSLSLIPCSFRGAWLGGTRDQFELEDVVGFGTLLGPEKTPCLVWVVSLRDRSWPGLSNASPVGVVVVGWVGVWLCVECCIVDASILLWW